MFGMCDKPGCAFTSDVRPHILVPAKPPPSLLSPPWPQAKGDGAHCFNQGWDGPDRYVVDYEIRIEFCRQHAEWFQWKDVINEALWSAIENQLTALGYAPPSKDDVIVNWVDACGPDGLTEEGRRFMDWLHPGIGFRPEEKDRLRRLLMA